MDQISMEDYIRLPFRCVSKKVGAVFGDDNRVPVSDTGIPPYNAIVRLLITDDGVQYRGTGFMIAPNIMLTAGHNVYNRDTRKFCNVKLLDSDGHVKREVCRCIIDSDYEKEDLDTYDWAVAEVSVDPKVIAPYINIMITDEPGFPDITGNEAEIAGFPVAVKGTGTDVMHTEKGAITGHDKAEKTLSYLIDTSGGNSGSPVIIYKDGAPYAAGIHVSSYMDRNSARAVTKDIAKVIADIKVKGLRYL